MANGLDEGSDEQRLLLSMASGHVLLFRGPPDVLRAIANAQPGARTMSQKPAVMVEVPPGVEVRIGGQSSKG